MKINLKDWILQQIKQDNIKELNEIQTLSFNAAKKQKNVIGIAPTGTGKTLAFLLPILENLTLQNQLQAIVITPTRELARQIHSKLLEFKAHQPLLSVRLLIGGESIDKQVNNLAKAPQIIISTPDRLLEIIKNKCDVLNWGHLKSIVIDEADMLLDLGFFNQIDAIFEFVNKTTNEQIQKFAYSATIHEMLSNKLSKYFTNSEIINLSTHQQAAKIEHIIIDNADKEHALSVILNKLNPYFCLIFANKKSEVDKIYQFLKKQNRDVIKIHGDLKTRERKASFKDIKKIRHQYVVCSDLLSRGTDIEGASHVINWNLANELEWYFHRAGRTGRGKYTGYCYILNDGKQTEIINRLAKKGINFKSYKIKNNDLLETKLKLKSTQVKISDEQQKEINKVLNKKVAKKPGYKKKRAEQIKKINSKYKRKEIEKKMNQERIKKYKMKIGN